MTTPETPAEQILKMCAEMVELRDSASQGIYYKDRDFPDSKTSNANIVGRFNYQSDAEFHIHAANHASQMARALAVLTEALEELNEHTSSHLEDMTHYFENRCIPTVDEVNMCANADSTVRYAPAKAAAILNDQMTTNSGGAK